LQQQRRWSPQHKDQQINNSTLGGNYAAGSYASFAFGGSISSSASTVYLQNTILANNFVQSVVMAASNCHGSVPSQGYNLSSDSPCNFSNSGDRNNIDPMLGLLQNNGRPTQTIPLLSGSPAIDAGNPSGCTDGLGHLLTTDQRGHPHPDSAQRTRTVATWGRMKSRAISLPMNTCGLGRAVPQTAAPLRTGWLPLTFTLKTTLELRGCYGVPFPLS